MGKKDDMVEMVIPIEFPSEAEARSALPRIEQMLTEVAPGTIVLGAEIMADAMKREAQERAALRRSGQLVRATPKIGANESCPCGSGRKYKKCCLPRR